MSDHDITADDIEAACRVLEHIRDEWALANHVQEKTGDVHYFVQRFEEFEESRDNL